MRLLLLVITIVLAGCEDSDSSLPVAPIKKAAVEAAPVIRSPAGLTDDERFALLKPEMTLEEVSQLWEGIPLKGQDCAWPGWMNAYEFRLKGSGKPVLVRFHYFPVTVDKTLTNEVHLVAFASDTFRYELRGQRYVVVDRPK